MAIALVCYPLTVVKISSCMLKILAAFSLFHSFQHLAGVLDMMSGQFSDTLDHILLAFFLKACEVFWIMLSHISNREIFVLRNKLDEIRCLKSHLCVFGACGNRWDLFIL